MLPPDRSGGRPAGSPSTPDDDDATRSQADDATDSHEALMRATYRALCEHGYADLTMGDIAEEADRSTSLLHYHYDTKEGLFVAFLNFMLDEFGDTLVVAEDASPPERLTAVIDRLLGGIAADDAFEAGTAENFHTAMFELRAQAPYVPAYRTAIASHDDYLHALLVEIIEAGMDAGVFRERNPDVVAATLLAAVRGERGRSIVLDDGSTTESVREGLREFVIDALVVDDYDGDFGAGRPGETGTDPDAAGRSDATATPDTDATAAESEE
jgi:AcrR family transcriptional regulator